MCYNFSFCFTQDLYFVGQYAAPVTCLDDMKVFKIAGMTALTMELEAHRFYEIVRNLMENVLPEKSKYCEFVYFDGMYIDKL